MFDFCQGMQIPEMVVLQKTGSRSHFIFKDLLLIKAR